MIAWASCANEYYMPAPCEFIDFEVWRENKDNPDERLMDASNLLSFVRRIPSFPRCSHTIPRHRVRISMSRHLALSSEPATDSGLATFFGVSLLPVRDGGVRILQRELGGLRIVQFLSLLGSDEQQLALKDDQIVETPSGPPFDNVSGRRITTSTMNAERESGSRSLLAPSSHCSLIISL